MKLIHTYLVKKKSFDEYFYKDDYKSQNNNDVVKLSGALLRNYFQKGNTPPDWLLDPEISKLILIALNNGEKVFID